MQLLLQSNRFSPGITMAMQHTCLVSLPVFCRAPLLQEMLADGCHLTRDTLAAIRAAGFEVEGGEAPSGAGLRLGVEGMGVLAPHVAGLVSLRV